MSKEAVDRNGKVWSSNLPPLSKKLKRGTGIVVVNRSLAEFVKLPLKKDVLGRYHFLYHDLKQRSERVKLLTQELLQL